MSENTVWLYALTAFLVVLIVLLTVFCGKRPPCNRTKAVVYAAIMIALSFGLSYVRLFSLPQGGSITLASLLPVLLYSYMFGIRKGVLVGVICGILNFIQAPWFLNPVQFLLDYPIAFGAMGLSGIFFRSATENKRILRFLLGSVVAVSVRYIAHVVSGIFVYGSADPSYGAVAWSFLYNAFVFADCAVALVVGCSLLASKHITGFLADVNK